MPLNGSQMKNIQTVLNNLNDKMLKFNDQKREIEEEIQKNLITLSTHSLNTDRSLAELSEMLTIQDYQSIMESHIGTEVLPSSRKPLEDKQITHHTKN